MSILMPNEREFASCGNITLEQVKEALTNTFEKYGIPVGFKYDKVKEGPLSYVPCLVVYNPQNLEYHTYVFVISNVNNRNVISYYGAGVANALHIGGGITNLENMKTQGRNVLKSAKQKKAEERDYIATSGIACDDALILLGVFTDDDFSYRKKRHFQKIDNQVVEEKVVQQNNENKKSDTLFDKLRERDFKVKSENATMDSKKRNLDRIEITLYEAFTGCQKKTTIKLTDKCNQCNGSGKIGSLCHQCNGVGEVQATYTSVFGTKQKIIPCPSCKGRNKCKTCNGQGYTCAEKEVTVIIPPGIENGQSILLRKAMQYDPASRSMQRLAIPIYILEDDRFTRKGMDIYFRLKVSESILMNGGEVRVPTIDGQVLLKVASGTKVGSKIKLKGKGMPSVKDATVRGEQYVILEI